MNRILAVAVLILTSALPPGEAGAARIRVSQESRPGAGDFAENVLGHISAVSAPGTTARAFYAYNETAYYSYSGRRPVLRPDTSHLFLVRTKEGLTLFIVHDRPNDPDGGSATVRVEARGDPDGVRILVRDDPFSEYDDYRESADHRTITAWHAWFPCCTDGLAIGTLEGRWKVYVRFLPEATEGGAGRGLKSWTAISADDAEVALHLAPGRRVLLEPVGFMVRRPLPPGRRSRPAPQRRASMLR